MLKWFAAIGSVVLLMFRDMILQIISVYIFALDVEKLLSMLGKALLFSLWLHAYITSHSIFCFI